MKYKCVSKFLCEVCGARDSLQIFYNNKGIARYYRVRHRDANKRFHYHQQTKPYAEKELEKHRETLSQAAISDSSKGLVDLGHNRNKDGQAETSSILGNSWASSSVRIEHQPPKLGVEGSNPSPPASICQMQIYTIAFLPRRILIRHTRTPSNTNTATASKAKSGSIGELYVTP